MRESFVSFVLTNMPMLYPLLKKLFEIIGSSITVTSAHVGTGRAASNGQAYRLSSYPDKRGVKDPDPLPDDTRSGSEEHIIITCVDDSKATSSSQGIPAVGVDTDEHQARNLFQQGHIHAHAFPDPVHKHQRSPSCAPAAGGILVTKDFVVTEDYQINGANRSSDAYLDV